MKSSINARRGRLLKALAEGADPAAAAKQAGITPTQLLELREDPAFAEEFDRSTAVAIQQAARQRAVEGVQEPLISDGKVVLDDHGRPVAVRRYSDELLLALLRAARPEQFGRHYPLWLRLLAIAFVCAFCVWAVGTVLIDLMRQQAAAVR